MDFIQFMKQNGINYRDRRGIAPYDNGERKMKISAIPSITAGLTLTNRPKYSKATGAVRSDGEQAVIMWSSAAMQKQRWNGITIPRASRTASAITMVISSISALKVAQTLQTAKTKC